MIIILIINQGRVADLNRVRGAGRGAAGAQRPQSRLLITATTIIITTIIITTIVTISIFIIIIDYNMFISYHFRHVSSFMFVFLVILVFCFLFIVMVLWFFLSCGVLVL